MCVLCYTGIEFALLLLFKDLMSNTDSDIQINSQTDLTGNWIPGNNSQKNEKLLLETELEINIKL